MKLLSAIFLFALVNSTGALALTEQQKKEMAAEIAYQKQLKAEQAAKAPTTQKCSMVNGQIACGAPQSTGQPKPVAQPKPVVQTTVKPNGCSPGFAFHNGKCRPF